MANPIIMGDIEPMQDEVFTDAVTARMLIRAQENADVQNPIWRFAFDDLVENIKQRLDLIYAIDLAINEALEALDACRWQMGLIRATLVADGVPGSNEEQRKAHLMLGLDSDHEYGGLRAEEMHLEAELREFNAERDRQRDLRKLSLAMIESKAQE